MNTAILLNLSSVKDVNRPTVILVPNVRTQVGIEKSLIKEHGLVVATEFFTLAEYIDELTMDYRIVNGIELLEPLQEAQFMLRILKKPQHRALFAEHQLDVDLARLLLQEYMKIALEPSFNNVFYEKYSEALTAIYEDYEAQLKVENKWDKVSMYKHFINVKDVHIGVNVHHFSIHDYLPIELKMIEKLGSSAISGYENDFKHKLTMYKTYGDKVGLDHFIEQVMAKNNLDDIAILYTDEQLVAQIDTALSRYNIPATYSRGVPFTTARLYDVVVSLFEYIEYNYQTIYIKNVLLNGELNFSKIEDVETDFTVGTISQLFKLSGIEYGKRVPRLVRKHIEEIIKDSSNMQLNEIEQQQNEINIQKLNNLASYFEQLQEQLENLKNTEGNYFDVLLEILTSFISKKHFQLKIELKCFIDQIYKLKESAPSFESFKHFKLFLLKELQNTKWNASSEKPGMVHVSYYEDQLIVNRKIVAVYGLDSKSFPKLLTSSPFIREDQYAQLQLQTPQESLQKSMDKLHSILSTVKESVYLYANTFNTNKVREQNESIFFKKYLEPGQEVACITYENDRLGSEMEEPEQMKAETFTIDWHERDEQGEYVNILSPTAINTLLDCNRKYFFSKKLRVNRLEDLSTNVKSWLPNNVLGNLIHEVFEECLKLNDGNLLPKSEYVKLAEEIYEKYKEDYEPMHASHYEYELGRMNKVMDQFYTHLEESLQDGWQVYANEAKIPKGTFIKVEDESGDVIEVCITGRIDRIDKKEIAGEAIYRTIDYKTGNSKNVKQIQLYLYNNSLKNVVQKDNEEIAVGVGESAFYMAFEGEYIPYAKRKTESTLQRFNRKIQQFDLNNITFKSGSKPCMYCEFRQICSGLEANMNGNNDSNEQ